MNLLPIPALDGGHVMFLLYEIISGKKPSDKFLENAQMVGFVLLISLLLFANGNDIYKAIVEVKKKKKCNFYLHKSNDSLSLHRFTTVTNVTPSS
jgi:Zn-dependent protease